MENYLKGILYENFIKTKLLETNEQVYLWNDIPLDVFIQSKFFENYYDKLKFRKIANKHNITDTGCDIFYFNKQEIQWKIVQCKNYTRAITLDKLAGFYDLIVSTGLVGELHYTSRLSEPITRYNKRLVEFKHRPFKELKIDNNYIKLTPYQYQLDAYDKLKNKKRSILQLPCGMGKTLVSIMWAKQFDLIIIFSPLRQHAQQNLTRYTKEIDDYDEYILVDSDGDRDIENITKHINKKIILSTTYKSVDIIAKLIEFIPENKTVGIIIDEFHNLTYDCVSNKDSDFYKVFTKNYNYLFISATPRIFESEDDYAEIENITGNIEYKYEFGKAIQDKYICDYDVFVPDIKIKQDSMDSLYKELQIDNKTTIDHDIKIHFLLRCLEENGHSKCILYAQNIEDAKKFIESIDRIKKYHSLDIYTNIIIADTTHEQRNKILNEFQETHLKAILCSVRILDECIDIPKCDSIFITYEQSNKIRMIQRICRANRKNKENPNKKSGIYMWTNDYNELTNLVANLKEFDCTFTKEKIKICNVVNEKVSCIRTRKDIEYEMEYIEMDKIVVGIYRIETWSDKLNKVIKYIDDNKQKPSRYSDDIEIKNMGRWIQHQSENYKQRLQIMKSDDAYNKWTNFINEYSEYIKSNEDIWYEMFNKTKEYIDVNKCKPSIRSTDEQIRKLFNWLSKQQRFYRNKSNNMKNNEIYSKWKEFIDNYKEYFKDNEEEWNDMLDKLKKYIDIYKKRPVESSTDKNELKLINWLQTQLGNYKTKTAIMKNNDIYNEWTKFMDEYNEYFKPYNEIWQELLLKTESYIKTYGKRPSEDSKDDDTKVIGKWLSHQLSDFKNIKGGMINNERYDQFQTFIDKYNKYFSINTSNKIIIKENDIILS